VRRRIQLLVEKVAEVAVAPICRAETVTILEKALMLVTFQRTS
jgi:hypothetical protein